MAKVWSCLLYGFLDFFFSKITTSTVTKLVQTLIDPSISLPNKDV